VKATTNHPTEESRTEARQSRNEGHQEEEACRVGLGRQWRIADISRKNAATLKGIVTATSWQKHTVRGFISILCKNGTKIETSESAAGGRTYEAA
jgi:hypothetical protein